MERKIGEIFKYKGKTLKVVESTSKSCDNCHFFDGFCKKEEECGSCLRRKRTDNKPVIFVEVKDEQPQEQEEQPQKLNLCEVLKHCPEGFELYSTLHGKVNFVGIVEEEHPIIFMFTDKGVEFTSRVSSEGKYLYSTKGECILFPSKDQRDWSKFNAPWLKKERFDPKTLKPFDKVLVRVFGHHIWKVDFYSHKGQGKEFPYICVGNTYKYCIPYNDDTKHLIGTTDEAPKFYRHLED